LAQGLAAGSEGSPLEPLINPLAQTLGFSEDSEVDGVAQGLTTIGNALAADESPLSPLTAEFLAPVIGTSEMSDSSAGISGTIEEISEGLTDLTNEDSALAPLDPLTSALAEQALPVVSDGFSQLGQAIVDGSGMAGPAAPLVETIGNLLGGDRPTELILWISKPQDRYPLKIISQVRIRAAASQSEPIN